VGALHCFCAIPIISNKEKDESLTFFLQSSIPCHSRSGLCEHSEQFTGAFEWVLRLNVSDAIGKVHLAIS
jgi:hypothetical protein